MDHSVLTFPTQFHPHRALELGFKEDESFEEVIEAFVNG